jgi:hypothetical protein
MGSFTDIVLGFSFRPDTPDHVLAAFSALAVPRQQEPWEAPAPPLPPPMVFPEDHWSHWEPTDEQADPAEDRQPWAHPWSDWLSLSMSIVTPASSQMIWSILGRWTVSCRWNIKSWPEAILPALLWLGPHLEGDERFPHLLGYMLYGRRPVLIWLDPDGTIRGEDLDGGMSGY